MKFLQFILFATSLTSTLAKGNGNGNGNGGAQSSLTLLSNLVQTNSEQNGFNASNLAQTNSTTSNNNFINFCEGKTLTNGLQIKTGSCNGIVMGDIPTTDNIPSAKFLFPKNLDTIAANQNFTVQLQTKGFQTGVFTNANTNYYAAPQQLNNQGQIIGHCHVVIAPLSSLTSTSLGTPLGFVFFKGIDEPAVNGVSEAVVTGGLKAGAYRICSINTSANHTPLLVAVAQHDSMDDCVYFTVSDNAKGSSTGNGKGNGNHTNASGNGNGGGNGGSKTMGNGKGRGNGNRRRRGRAMELVNRGRDMEIVNVNRRSAPSA